MAVWFITGASRGFGRKLVDAAVQAGDAVIAGARNVEVLADRYRGVDSVLAVSLDVTDPTDPPAAVAAGLERFGAIDVVVNNAGFGAFGSVEETSDEAVRALFDTNVFGLLSVTRAVLPALRRQRHGHLINMSSSAGVAVSAGRGLYGASKFAVEAISEALHAELRPLGVQVTAVEPGSFRTDFLGGDSLRQTPVGISDYDDTVGDLLRAVERNAGHPDAPLRLALGSDAVRLVEDKLARVRTDLDEYRELSVSTDFDPR